MTEITLNGNLVLPTSQQEGGSHFATNASHSNYIILHSVDRLKNDQYDQLRRLELNVLQDVADKTYLCRYLPSDLHDIRKLPFVVYANVYHPDLVVHSILKSKKANTLNIPSGEEISDDPRGLQSQGVTATAEKMNKVCVVLHPECDRSAADIKIELSEKLGIRASEIYAGKSRLLMKVKLEDLQKIALLDEVQTIEEIYKDELNNEIARTDLMLINQASSSSSALSVTTTVNTAVGETIAVLDTGIDITHPALRHHLAENQISYRHLTPPPRLVDDPEQGLIEEPAPNPETADYQGHGTHIAGSIVGLYTSTRFGPVRGTALGARILMQVKTEWDGTDCTPRETPHGLQDMLQQAYDAGARIHSNSWSAPPDEVTGKKFPFEQLHYNADAVDYDTFVKTNGDFLILCSAGNSGDLKTDTKAQVAVHSSCKNVITVGSTLSSRRYRKNPNKSLVTDSTGTVFGDPNEIYFTSSKGPTRDGRIKPDVVGPGVGILSARSLNPDLIWPVRKRVGRSLVNDLNIYGIIINESVSPEVDLDPNLVYSTGTSMATPLVAGCCAVIRKQLRAKWPVPLVGAAHIPSALIKAILINGAVDLRGDKFLGMPPPRPIGFGRVNVERSLRIVKNNTYFPRAAIATPLEFPYELELDISTPGDDFTLTSSTKMRMVLSVTMCYHDVPGTTLSEGRLVNILNLKVTDDSGDFKYGNTGTSTKDSTNNVQKVVWPDLTGKKVTFTVECEGLGQGVTSQDFYLAWWFEYKSAGNKSNILSTLAEFMEPGQAKTAFSILVS